MFSPDALLGAGLKLFGGFLGSSDAAQNREAAEANAVRNIQYQKEFAQNALSWKVEDAKRAGVHPLYALGASGTSFSPVSIGSSSGSPMGDAFMSMGQDVSRAALANQSAEGRVTEVGKAMQLLQVENASLQNDLLRSQIARLNQQPTAPVPSPGANVVGGSDPLGVKIDQSKTEATSGNNPSQAAAVVPDVSFSETSTGLAPVPSKSVKDLVEDITIPQLMWGVRNNMLPIFGINQNPPSRNPGDGNIWVFHPGLGEYQAVPRNSWWARLFGRPRDLRN